MSPERRLDSLNRPTQASQPWITTESKEYSNPRAVTFSRAFSLELAHEFDKKGMSFDIRAFEKKLAEAASLLLSDPNVPEVAKTKFLADIREKIDLLSETTSDDVSTLRTRRAVMSLGLEPYELNGKYGDDDAKKQAFYLEKILAESIGKYVEPVSYALRRSYSPESVQHPSLKDVVYDWTNHSAFVSGFKKVDETLNLRVYERSILPLADKTDLSRKDYRFQIGRALIQELAAQGYRVKDRVYFESIVARANPLAEWVRASDRREGETTILDREGKPVVINGKKIDGVDLLLEYFSCVDRFQWLEHEMRSTREAVSSSGVTSKAKELFGMERLKSDYDYLKPENLDAKMKSASLADMAIIATQLVQLAPMIGDVSGGIDGVISSWSGMSIDGKRLDAIERTFNGIFWVLGITVVAGFASRLHKSGRLKELLGSFSSLSKYLPQKLEALSISERGLPKEAMEMFAKFGALIGGEAAWRIQKAIARQMEKMFSGKLTPEVRLQRAGIIDARVKSGFNIERKGTLHVVHSIPELASEKDLRIFFSEFFLKNPHAELSLSAKLGEVDRRRILSIVQNNYPLTEVIRLLPGHQVVDVTVLWVKHLNDTYSQEFMDLIRAELGKKIMDRFRESSTGFSHDRSRMVRDACKHMTPTIPNQSDAVSFLFPTDNRAAFLKSIVASLQPHIESFVRKNPEHTADKIKADILASLDFQVGVSKLPEGTATDMQKLRAFHSAEISARNAPRGERIIAHEGSENAIHEAARAVINMEASLRKRFDRVKYVVDGVEYPVVTHWKGESRINPQLLQVIRKGETKVLPSEVAQAFEEYIRRTNNGFDFIVPASGNIEEEFARAHALDSMMRSGRIRADMVLQNYKGTYTKEALMAASKGKEGMRIFIDVKNMGIMNLESFLSIASEIVRTGDTSLALKAGMDVTERFARTVKSIKEKYPNAKISLGGDEIFVFIEGATPTQEAKVLEEISRSLSANHLHARATHSFDTVSAPEEVYSQLDVRTKFNKLFESGLEPHFSWQSQQLPNLVHVRGGGPHIESLRQAAKKPRFKEFLESVADDIRSGIYPSKRVYESVQDRIQPWFRIQAETNGREINFSFI